MSLATNLSNSYLKSDIKPKGLKMQIKSLFIAVLFFSICSTAPGEFPATAQVTEDPKVDPSINKPFKAPDINADEFAKRFEGESREVFREREKIAKALNLKVGERIADIGAGTGIFVGLFSREVGGTGKVYAVDIAPTLLDYIKARAKRENLTNVETVLGQDKTTNLKDGSIDVAFHSDTYHHFEYALTMNRDIARALSSTGRLFVLDFERIPGVSDEQRLNHVRAGKEVVIPEIESSGFTFVTEHDVPGLSENYLLEFRKK